METRKRTNKQRKGEMGIKNLRNTAKERKRKRKL